MPSGFEETAPAGYAWVVTPSDSVEFVKHTRALLIGGAGNVAVQMFDPATAKLANVTLTGLTAGQVIPVRTKLVLATGTTATSIVALA
jgi:hypothetical protein